MGAVGRKSTWTELRFLWQPWNSTLNLTSLTIAILMSVSFMGSFVAIIPIYLALLLTFDVCYYVYGIAVIDENETLRQGYNLSSLLDDKGSATGNGLDYGFNFYNGNFKKSRQQAQRDKFDYCWEQLGLKEGMTVIDFGCGCGDWLAYLKERGVHGIGINITERQVKLCRERGLEVIHTDWKKIEGNPALEAAVFGKADAVTMWDTIEHYVPAKYFRQANTAQQDAIYLQLFQLVQKCFKKKSENVHPRAWTSCLHYRTTEVSLSQLFNNYLLDKFHSGNYPKYEDRQLTQNAQRSGYKQLFERNLTEDYYMTSVLSEEHFGRHKFSFTPFRIACLLTTMLVDPNWPQRFIWLSSEAWMCQFVPHKLDESPMQLLWIMWELV